MAAHHQERPRNVLCKYFMSGVCREGAACPFSHDWSKKPEMVCRYYLQGSCVYGSQCRYDHVKGPSAGRTRQTESERVLPEPVKLAPAKITVNLSQMVSLSKPSNQQPVGSFKVPENWADAPEFVPSWLQSSSNSTEKAADATEADIDDYYYGTEAPSYSDAARAGIEVIDELSAEEAASLLCPFAEMGSCPFETCPYLHGLVCDICGKQCLHPYNPQQQEEHKRECQVEIEKDIEYTFAYKRSQGIQCSICLDVVMDKRNPVDRRFGILSDCKHPFCLPCIRKWRNLSHADNKIIRACPICRVPSWFVTPSITWIVEDEEKKRLIDEYKQALSAKPCRYYNFGNGSCPFGTSCFYKHVAVDGTVQIPDVQLRHYCNAEGESRVVKTPKLWDFMKPRTEPH
ncbi:uncharacterized protein [Oscarella lobularis]|uniref:uncharacterized protein n=1 Tax=Oscarella lobularis TaxID=121494 RepID=UPI00331401A7